MGELSVGELSSGVECCSHQDRLLGSHRLRHRDRNSPAGAGLEGGGGGAKERGRSVRSTVLSQVHQKSSLSFGRSRARRRR
eukprot:SAG31_NODE_13754_length_849_cov_1.061333_2_plen_80_part_01